MRNHLPTGKSKLRLVLAIVAMSAATANATVLDTLVSGPTSYHLLSLNDWPTAEAEAVALGGHLVTVDSAAENELLWSTWGSEVHQLWIGLSDHVSEGTFAWASGAPVAFTNWSAGQPDDFEGNQDFAYMSDAHVAGPGQWDDSGPNLLLGIAEVAAVPEPSTALGLVLGLALFGLLRGRDHGCQSR